MPAFSTMGFSTAGAMIGKSESVQGTDAITTCGLFILGIKNIYALLAEDVGVGVAINDRLKKAAQESS